jgi:hypothetical protein
MPSISSGTMSCSTETVTAAAAVAVVAVGGGVERIEGGEKVAVVVAVVVVVVVAVVVAVMVVLGDGRVERVTDVVPKACRRPVAALTSCRVHVVDGDAGGSVSYR